MVSLCYTYVVSCYVIRRLWYGELVLYIYDELLCNLRYRSMYRLAVYRRPPRPAQPGRPDETHDSLVLSGMRLS